MSTTAIVDYSAKRISLPTGVVGMGEDFWKEWAGIQATLATQTAQTKYNAEAIARLEQNETQHAANASEHRERINTRLESIEKVLETISRRIDSLEGIGVEGWRLNKLKQWGLISAAIAGLVSGAVALYDFFHNHWK